MKREEEQIIIKKILAGDKAAFEELVLENQKNVYNLALKLTGNEEDALDMSQEAFLKAYLGLKSFRGESKFSVWLYRLTYNLCIDFLRKKSKMPSIPLSYTNDGDKDGGDYDIPDLRELPEDALINKEKRKIVLESIEELDFAYKEILILREITGMTYADIALTLNISEGTVKSRLSRARQNLVSILAKKGTFPDNYRQNGQKEAEGHD